MKIASWNLEGRLSDLARGGRGTPERIAAAIRALDADVLVHPEAFGTDPAVTPEIERALGELGYDSRSVAYDDAEGRGDKASFADPHMRILSRLAIGRCEVIRPGGLRSMLSVTVADPESGRDLRVIGVHLDDRSEARRLVQVSPLIEHINGSILPTVVMGDFNAMPPHRLKSTVIHSSLFRRFARAVPHDHMAYTISRLSEMAAGTTIGALLNETRLRNTDPRFQPTTTPKMRRMEWMPSVRVAKIDWILVSPGIKYSDFKISRDLGSDHRALSLEISLVED